MISTRFTRMLKVAHPIALAALGGVGRAELAAAVSNAGALGMLAMIRMPPDFIRRQIRRTRELTDRPFGVNLVPPVAPESGFESQLSVCIEERVPLVSLFWCEAAPYVPACHAAGIKVMLQVGTAKEAREARAANVDIIVAQGMEAGGHVRGEVGLFPLLPTIVEAVAPTPVLGAGGIVNGRGLAAALSLGAEGVVVGTRFVASRECEAHAEYKQRLTSAEEVDTVRGNVFHVGWPPNSPHRTLRNAFTNGGAPSPGPVARLRRGDETIEVPPFSSMTPSIHVAGQTQLMANYAGQGVALIRDVLPAAEIVERMVSEAEAAIHSVSAMVRDSNAV